MKQTNKHAEVIRYYHIDNDIEKVYLADMGRSLFGEKFKGYVKETVFMHSEGFMTREIKPIEGIPPNRVVEALRKDPTLALPFARLGLIPHSKCVGFNRVKGIRKLQEPQEGHKDIFQLMSENSKSEKGTVDINDIFEKGLKLMSGFFGNPLPTKKIEPAFEEVKPNSEVVVSLDKVYNVISTLNRRLIKVEEILKKRGERARW